MLLIYDDSLKDFYRLVSYILVLLDINQSEEMSQECHQ